VRASRQFVGRQFLLYGWTNDTLSQARLSGVRPLPQIIAVGACQGAVEALAEIVAGLPADFGAAIVITLYVGSGPCRNAVHAANGVEERARRLLHSVGGVSRALDPLGRGRRTRRSLAQFGTNEAARGAAIRSYTKEFSGNETGRDHLGAGRAELPRMRWRDEEGNIGQAYPFPHDMQVMR
jgi:hypothetical protein